MQAEVDPVKKVLLRCLHDRGYEVSDVEFRDWLAGVAERSNLSYEGVCHNILRGDILATELRRRFCRP